MGCDYYIIKELVIKYKQNDGSEKEKKGTIELERQRCYFVDSVDISCDSDDSDYYPRLRAFQEQYIADCMKVTFIPRTLFENGQWKNKETEAKYSEEIKREFGDITLVSIVKREVRYLR
jgi:hypothetical protein